MADDRLRHASMEDRFGFLVRGEVNRKASKSSTGRLQLGVAGQRRSQSGRIIAASCVDDCAVLDALSMWFSPRPYLIILFCHCSQGPWYTSDGSLIFLGELQAIEQLWHRHEGSGAVDDGKNEDGHQQGTDEGTHLERQRMISVLNLAGLQGNGFNGDPPDQVLLCNEIIILPLVKTLGISVDGSRIGGRGTMLGFVTNDRNVGAWAPPIVCSSACVLVFRTRSGRAVRAWRRCLCFGGGGPNK